MGLALYRVLCTIRAADLHLLAPHRGSGRGRTMAVVSCEDCGFRRERDMPIELAREIATYHTRQTGHVSIISHNWPLPPMAVIPSLLEQQAS